MDTALQSAVFFVYFCTMFRERINDNTLAAMCRALNTTMTIKQGDAVRFITAECDAIGITDPRQVAYILGTVYNECRFKSIPEIRAKAGTAVWKLQEKYWHTGYYGRGYSQLTWKRNYAKFSGMIGVDLVKHPDKVLEPEVGAKIIVYGMFHGMFTGKKLATYFNAVAADWMSARAITNGKLKGQKYGFMAKECADAALKILEVLKT